MTCLIKRLHGGQTMYFSHRIGRDYGAPQGGWTPEIRKATFFGGEGAAQAFIDEVIPEAERASCRIQELNHDHPRSP